MTRTRRLLALPLVAVLGLTSCGVPLQDEAAPVPTEGVLADLISPTTPPPPTTTTTSAPPVPVDPPSSSTTIDTLPVEVWLVRDDRLVASFRRLPVPASLPDLVTMLRSGPDERDRERSLRSAIPESEQLETTSAGGVATVALTADFVNLPANDQLLAVGQIVRSLTSYPGVGQVRFVIDGEPIAVVRGDGSAAPGAVSRDDYLPLVA